MMPFHEQLRSGKVSYSWSENDFVIVLSYPMTAVVTIRENHRSDPKSPHSGPGKVNFVYEISPLQLQKQRKTGE
jgi:hypothetical protein